ncbi:MAG: hypothetical protein M1833_006920 [Piccolia ochrophora]|nr:MAG: hypothetical protein M1833_006920 [Piccolia ochrophora]
METTDAPTLLLLNLPPQSLCGIDLLSFTTTPRFHGIRYLPPGWHFVFASPTLSVSVRSGTWFYISPSKSHSDNLIIKKWDPSTEELTNETDPSECLRWKANLGALWNDSLTPYRQSASEANDADARADWTALISHLTPPLLTRMTSSTDADGTSLAWNLSSASSARADLDEQIPELPSSLPIKPLSFLPINLKQTWRSGAIGRERTDAAKDRSWALGDLVVNHCSAGNEMEVVGELQVVFVTALVLGNYSCREQWRRLLTLLLTCRSAVTERTRLFVSVFEVLKVQLRRGNEAVDGAGGGVLELQDEGGTMLKGLLRNFRRGLEQIEEADEAETDHKEVMTCFKELERFVKREFNWELGDEFVRRGMLELEDGEMVEMEVGDMEGEDERGEYAPVVVDLEGEALEAERSE